MTSLTSLILVGCPHTGHTSGTLILPLSVRLAAICGIIILALNTLMLSPIPSFRPSIILILWTLALDTLVPSSSTGSNMATGLIRPVLEALHSICLKTVSAVSSVHLNAIAFLGNLAVLPSDSPYAISSYMITRPSDGKSLFTIVFSNHAIVSIILSLSTILYSTTSNPCFLSHSNWYALEFLKSTLSADTSANAKKLTLRSLVILLLSCLTEPLQRFLGFLYFASISGISSLILLKSE